MLVSFVPMLLALQLVLVASDRVPTLNVERSCRGAVTSGVVEKRSLEACVESEHKARETLIKDWKQFSASDRSKCLQTSTMGGQGSYVEYLTCLEMERDVRKLPNKPSERPVR